MINWWIDKYRTCIERILHPMFQSWVLIHQPVVTLLAHFTSFTWINLHLMYNQEMFLLISFNSKQIMNGSKNDIAWTIYTLDGSRTNTCSALYCYNGIIPQYGSVQELQHIYHQLLEQKNLKELSCTIIAA